MLYGAWVLPPHSGCHHIPLFPLSWQGWVTCHPACLPSAEWCSSSFPDHCCQALTSTGPGFWETTACSLALRHTAKAFITFVCFLGLEGMSRPFFTFCYFLRIFLMILSFYACDLKHSAAGPMLYHLAVQLSCSPWCCAARAHALLSCSGTQQLLLECNWSLVILWFHRDWNLERPWEEVRSAALHCPITPTCVAGFLSSHLWDVVHPLSFLFVPSHTWIIYMQSCISQHPKWGVTRQNESLVQFSIA